VKAHGVGYPRAALEEGVMGKEGDEGTSQAGGIKGGLITTTRSPEARRSKNEVAIETLEIAHEGLGF